MNMIKTNNMMKIVSQSLFEKFIEYFPTSCVDIVLFFDRKFCLSKRKIPPYRGYWHIPGGIIRRDEKMIIHGD